jgi:hypothetical protein
VKDTLSTLSVADIKQKLVDSGLSRVGKKADLVVRLRQHLAVRVSLFTLAKSRYVRVEAEAAWTFVREEKANQEGGSSSGTKISICPACPPCSDCAALYRIEC